MPKQLIEHDNIVDAAAAVLVGRKTIDYHFRKDVIERLREAMDQSSTAIFREIAVTYRDILADTAACSEDSEGWFSHAQVDLGFVALTLRDRPEAARACLIGAAAEILIAIEMLDREQRAAKQAAHLAALGGAVHG
ncbi:MAG: hypothetical protein ACE5EM_01315 [Sphingomonadales bacterium]